MLKCAPYIKNLCSSLQSGLWKEANSRDGGLPSSLPGSPIRRQARGGHHEAPSPTRSEGGGSEQRPGANLEAVSMPVLMVSRTTEKDGEVITTAVKPSESLLKKPESPDVTRVAKKLELSNSLGAISKVRMMRLSESSSSPTASTTSSNSSSSTIK